MKIIQFRTCVLDIKDPLTSLHRISSRQQTKIFTKKQIDSHGNA